VGAVVPASVVPPYCQASSVPLRMPTCTAWFEPLKMANMFWLPAVLVYLHQSENRLRGVVGGQVGGRGQVGVRARRAVEVDGRGVGEGQRRQATS